MGFIEDEFFTSSRMIKAQGQQQLGDLARALEQQRLDPIERKILALVRQIDQRLSPGADQKLPVVVRGRKFDPDTIPEVVLAYREDNRRLKRESEAAKAKASTMMIEKAEAIEKVEEWEYLFGSIEEFQSEAEDLAYERYVGDIKRQRFIAYWLGVATVAGTIILIVLIGSVV